jgi:hypothetical protein
MIEIEKLLIVNCTKVRPICAKKTHCDIKDAQFSASVGDGDNDAEADSESEEMSKFNKRHEHSADAHMFFQLFFTPYHFLS